MQPISYKNVNIRHSLPGLQNEPISDKAKMSFTPEMPSLDKMQAAFMLSPHWVCCKQLTPLLPCLVVYHSNPNITLNWAEGIVIFESKDNNKEIRSNGTAGGWSL